MTLNVQDVLQKSENRLSGLHPLVHYLAVKLITQSFAAGVPIVITQGLRTTDYQNQLYAQGRTAPGPIVTNARAPRSFHCHGLAIDFALLLPDGKTASWDTVRDGDKDKHRDWYEVAEIGKRIGFEWGGDWDKFIDLPHFQYTFGLSIDSLLRGAKPVFAADKANKIIESELQPAWKAAKEKNDEAGMKQAAALADDLRKASNQPTKNG